MDNYSLTQTPKTPFIRFVAENGELEIRGRSIPENSIDLYKPAIRWIEEYTKQPNKATTLRVRLEYFNTSTSKCLVEMFRKIAAIKNSSDVRIIWYYEEDDEDMLESGKDFMHIIDLPIELVSVKN